jgi:hypothetical protein
LHAGKLPAANQGIHDAATIGESLAFAERQLIGVTENYVGLWKAAIFVLACSERVRRQSSAALRIRRALPSSQFLANRMDDVLMCWIDRFH